MVGIEIGIFGLQCSWVESATDNQVQGIEWNKLDFTNSYKKHNQDSCLWWGRQSAGYREIIPQELKEVLRKNKFLIEKGFGHTEGEESQSIEGPRNGESATAEARLNARALEHLQICEEIYLL